MQRTDRYVNALQRSDYNTTTVCTNVSRGNVYMILSVTRATSTSHMLTLALNSSTVNFAGPPVNASVPTWYTTVTR
jgi:hypothetical protein